VVIYIRLTVQPDLSHKNNAFGNIIMSCEYWGARYMRCCRIGNEKRDALSQKFKYLVQYQILSKPHQSMVKIHRWHLLHLDCQLDACLLMEEFHTSPQYAGESLLLSCESCLAHNISPNNEE